MLGVVLGLEIFQKDIRREINVNRYVLAPLYVLSVFCPEQIEGYTSQPTYFGGVL